MKKIKISREMNRCIEEMKKEALTLVLDIPLMQSLKIQRKATKKKTFDFHIINLGKPAMRVFVNERFYKSYIYSNEIWSEEG